MNRRINRTSNLLIYLAAMCFGNMIPCNTSGSIDCSSDSLLSQHYLQLIGQADSSAMTALKECLQDRPHSLVDSAIVAFNDRDDELVLKLLQGMSERIELDKQQLSDLYFVRGIAQLHLGRYKSALQDLNRTSSDDSQKTAIAFSHKSFILNALKRFEEGLSYADSALAIIREYANAWNNRGHSLSGLGRLHDAMDSYDSSLFYDPVGVEVRSNKALIFLELGQYREAIASTDTAIQFSPRFGIVWQTRGSSYLMLGEANSAVRAFDSALSMGVSNERLWSQRGMALRKLDRNEEALVSYDSCLKHNSQNYTVWGNRGVILKELGRTLEALRSYEKSLEIDATHHGIWVNRGALLYGLKRYKEAVVCFDRAIAFGNREMRTFDLKGKSLGQLGKFSEANECLDAALTIDNTSGSIWLGKSFMMMELGDSYLPAIWRALDSAAYYDQSLNEVSNGMQKEILRILKKAGKKIPGINQ